MCLHIITLSLIDVVTVHQWSMAEPKSAKEDTKFFSAHERSAI